MNKDKKDNEFKELFAPIVALGKAFAKTGDESIASIVKAAALESKHEKINKLAVVYADFFRKGLFHCIRSIELKDFLKTLENDEIKFPKISEEKRRDSIKYLSTYLSILNKYMDVDQKTGFWTINKEFEGKVTYFKVDIEEGSLLNSPKILKVAAIDVNHNQDIQQSLEQKGEYNEELEEKPVASTVGNEEKTLSGGFAPGFHLAQTKHEQKIDAKYNNELIENLKKVGVDLGPNGLNGVDLVSLFKMDNKRELGMDNSANKQAKKNSEDSPSQSLPSASSTSSGRSASALGTASSASKSGTASKTSAKSGTASSASSRSCSFSGSPSKSSKESPSTPMKTTTGKFFFKKLKSSPKTTTTGKKYCHVQASVPIKSDHSSDKFEVVLGITAINELNRGEDKHMFEFRAPVFIKSWQTCYSTWDEDDYKFEVGSMSNITERLLESHAYSGRIRAHPGLLNNDFVSFRTYAKYQAILRVNLEATNLQDANNEVPLLIAEIQKILASPDWFLCYQIAAYWEYVCPENTLQVDDVLNELWTKAAGKEENPSFNLIKNGLPKVFRAAMQRARGGLYGAMITDARCNLSQDLGSTPIVSKIGLKLDEFLVDEDIAAFATYFFKGYTREAAQVLFKTQFDDRNMNNFF
ncbi:predicted protein [Chaetoceros tenuissimus]|nr:predicted protein [Chaetoceros tenuissimus]